MRRLHVERLPEGDLVLGGAEFRYLARVLRVEAGDAVTLFDGEGREAEARVVEIDEAAGTITLRAEAVRAGLGGAPIALVVALLKGEKMELVVQKATELGVARVVPVATERAVVQLSPARAGERAVRWRKIAREAARQCGRADVPEVDTPTTLAAGLAIAGYDTRVLLHEAERGATLRGALTGATRSIAVAVGPEGGFAPAEVEAARAAGWSVVGLGARVLRAETAAIAAVTLAAWTLGAIE